MQLELINIGRNKVCQTIEMKKPTANKIFKEVKKHLLSKEIDFIESEVKGIYNVFVGGLRNVGQIKLDPPSLLLEQ